jgi:CBS domain containing-hemolysin-like protein
MSDEERQMSDDPPNIQEFNTIAGFIFAQLWRLERPQAAVRAELQRGTILHDRLA